MPNKIYVLCGPSGVGKSTLANEWAKSDSGLVVAPSVTTREPRLSELESTNYRFVSKEVFCKMSCNGKFVQVVQPLGNHYYGTEIAELSEILYKKQDAILDYSLQGYLNIKSEFKNLVVGIFIEPPNLDILRIRLSKRGKVHRDEIDQRMQLAKSDMKSKKIFEFCLVNTEINDTVSALERIRLKFR